MPGRFDPQALAGGLAGLRGAAQRPIGATLRINPRPGTSVGAISDTAVAARDGAGVEDVFVELMYHADDVDGSLRLVGEIVEALTGR